jgi:hypothetical protein
MELSKAIREGAKLRPQAFGAYVCGDATCVEGAAIDGLNGRKMPNMGLAVTDTLRAHYPFMTQDADCPVCGDEYAANVDCVMVHLNDAHRWSREQIADWVEQFETKTV